MVGHRRQAYPNKWRRVATVVRVIQILAAVPAAPLDVERFLRVPLCWMADARPYSTSAFSVARVNV